MCQTEWCTVWRMGCFVMPNGRCSMHGNDVFVVIASDPVGAYADVDPEGHAEIAFRLIHDEEPRPGVRGFSVHVYNDGGPDHGFAEIECSLPAVLGEYGRSSCMDTIATWIYVGKEENLKRIGKILLGCEVEFQ